MNLTGNTETSIKKTFKAAIALIAVFSLFPVTIKAADNINSLLTKLEYSENAETCSEIKKDIKALVSTNKEAANTALYESYDKNKSSNYNCALIDVLSSSEDPTILKGLANHINSGNDAIRLCASKSAGQNNSEAAIDALFNNIDNYTRQAYTMYLTKGHYEENLKRKLAVIDSIWALGEIGNPIIIKRLTELYNKSDEVLQVNIVISIGKTKSPKAIKILKAIANSSGEAPILRATAWEMIDYANGVKQ